MSYPTSSILTPINVGEFLLEGFEFADQSQIPSFNIESSFDPEINKVEFFIYDFNKSLLYSEFNFADWGITENTDTTSLTNTNTIDLDPLRDVYDRGFDVGSLYAVYNFVNYELNSSPSNLYYISEISSDRTEIRLKSNFISNEEIASTFDQFRLRLDSAEYFDEFYVCSPDNIYNIGVNIQLDVSDAESYSILVKLYDALPPQFDLRSELYIATKVAESLAYQVQYPLERFVPPVTYLRGPNTNLEIKDFGNNSTELLSKRDLLGTLSSQSYQQLQNKLEKQGVSITPNYSYDTFNEFVHFSSAKQRILNFYEKVSQIETYQNDLNTIASITGPTSASSETSASKAILENRIETIIKNFDGYDYFLYYTSGSSAWPKSNTESPYILYSTGSTEVLTWLGSDVENNPYYGGILLSASLYDYSNQNWLWYTIPEFIKEDSENDNYTQFANMVGQHFDEVWLYTKEVTEKLNTTNDLEDGVPLELVQEVIRSLGFEVYGNNFNNTNIYYALLGEDSGSYLPPTGSELITDYIAINVSGSSTTLDITDNFPYPIDKVSKEIYKRLYHNMAYLVKKKGTVAGLRQLINIWGIPDTILRINEFGGKNQDNSDDYDYWYQRFSKAWSPNLEGETTGSTYVRVPWSPLHRNYIAENELIVPDALAFRFKTFGIPTGSFITQSLIVKRDSDTGTEADFGIALYYTGSNTGSYSGSYTNDYSEYGVLRFYLSGSSAEGGTVVSDDIYLPFFDKGWWSVLLQRDQHVSASVNDTTTTYTIYAKNKIYNGFDGNSIGFEGSSSITIDGSTSSSLNASWNNFSSDITQGGVYIGGNPSGSTIGDYTIGNENYLFSGSLQEFRYYSNDIPEVTFNDFVMNPESIEGNSITGSESSFDIVNFRAPLGNELEFDFTSSGVASSTTLTSLHPAISGEASLIITQSFINSGLTISESNYYFYTLASDYTGSALRTNREAYLLDQPSMGVRNRITNKIQAPNMDFYGNVLSAHRSLQQKYQTSQSYTEDITSLEVAFSPQDEINDDIIATYGFGAISPLISDPRFVSESLDYYPELKKIAYDYFKKYSQGNIYDYIRLIKYIDNSLFKSIKAYVPARTKVNTGIVIKQHMLERNRYRTPLVDTITKIATTPETGSVFEGLPPSGYNSPIEFQNLEVTSSIGVGRFSGGTGGTLEQFNYYGPTTINWETGNPGSASFGQTNISQSWEENVITVSGSVIRTQDYQDEFYDGEFSGSTLTVTTQSLLDNPFLLFGGESNPYKLYLYTSSFNDVDNWIGGGMPNGQMHIHIQINDKYNAIKLPDDTIIPTSTTNYYGVTYGDGGFQIPLGSTT